MKTIKYSPMLVAAVKLAAIIGPITWLVIMLFLVPINKIAAIAVAVLMAAIMYFFGLYIEKWSIEFDDSCFIVHNISKVTEVNYSDIEKLKIRSVVKNDPEFSKEVRIKLKNDRKNVIRITLRRDRPEEMEFLGLLTSKTS